MTAQDTIAQALELVPAEKLYVASSFGLEDVVLIHMFVKHKAPIHYFTLDSGRLHEETYKTMDAIREEYGIQIEVLFPQAQTVEELVQAKGLYSFRNSIEDRKYCCRIRKLEPLSRALKNAMGWACGLRKEQSPTRTTIEKIERDPSHRNIWKFNPLADWSLDEVWDYIKEHKIPYNTLHDQGYPSIGCAPCTRAIKPGEDERAGRWWWENPEHKECGIHAKQPGELK